jgi:hypothetical protein
LFWKQGEMRKDILPGLIAATIQGIVVAGVVMEFRNLEERGICAKLFEKVFIVPKYRGAKSVNLSYAVRTWR